jgi:hypothetical protein
MATNDAGTVLPSALRRFQRRLRLAAFIRHVTVASALALVVAGAVVLASPPDITILAVFTAAIALGVVAAVALAIVTTPSLHDTARIVDRELLLQDRAVSALQFSRTMDPIARLVVTDAAARLGAISVSRLPISIPAPARWLAVSALMVSVTIVVSRGGPAPDAITTPGSAGAAAAPSGRSPRAQPQRAGAGATETPQQGGAAPAQSTPSRADARQPGAARGAAGDARERSKDVTGQEPADGSTPRADSPSRPSESRLAGTGNATSTEKAHQSGSATLNAPAGAASAPGAAAGGAAGRHGGGVRGGALLSAGPHQAQASPPSVNRRTASYAEAYARAEAAVPAERVPAGLRSYVRAYFLAIRPGSNP